MCVLETKETHNTFPFKFGKVRNVMCGYRMRKTLLLPVYAPASWAKARSSQGLRSINTIAGLEKMKDPLVMALHLVHHAAGAG